MNDLENMVNSLVQGDKESAADAFNAIFTQKASAALNSYKAEIGRTMFNGSEVKEEALQELTKNALLNVVDAGKNAGTDKGRKIDGKALDKISYGKFNKTSQETSTFKNMSGAAADYTNKKPGNRTGD